MLSNNLYYKLLGKLLSSVMDILAFLYCLLMNKYWTYVLAFSWCAVFRLAETNTSFLLQSIWMQLFNNTTLNNWHTSALKEWLHTACINHLAEQKYRVIVIEQYHMINTFPLEILVPQRLEMIYGQNSPWHFSPSSRLLSCDIFLWRQMIRNFFRKNLNELTLSWKERNNYYLNEEVQTWNSFIF